MTFPLPQRRLDEDDFQAALQGEDALGMVVRAHIHLERCLNELISALVKDAIFVDKMNLDYSQKVNLAVALGLNASYGPALQVMGTLRNAFAHRADAILGRQEVNNLYKAFPADDKTMMASAYESTKKKAGITNLPNFRELAMKEQFIFMVMSLRALLMFAITAAEVKKSAA